MTIPEHQWRFTNSRFTQYHDFQWWDFRFWGICETKSKELKNFLFGQASLWITYKMPEIHLKICRNASLIYPWLKFGKKVICLSDKNILYRFTFSMYIFSRHTILFHITQYPWQPDISLCSDVDDSWWVPPLRASVFSHSAGVCMIFSTNSSKAHSTPSLVLAEASMNIMWCFLAHFIPSSLVTTRSSSISHCNGKRWNWVS